MLPHIGEETIRVPGDDLSVGLIFLGDFIRAILDGFAAHQTVKDNPAYFVDLQVFTGVVDEDDRPALLGIQGYLILRLMLVCVSSACISQPPFHCCYSLHFKQECDVRHRHRGGASYRRYIDQSFLIQYSSDE